MAWIATMVSAVIIERASVDVRDALQKLLIRQPLKHRPLFCACSPKMLIAVCQY